MGVGVDAEGPDCSACEPGSAEIFRKTDLASLKVVLGC